MTARRHSIGAPVSLHGIGLHLGRECRLTFHPAPASSGIVFRRTDLPDAPTVLARAEHAVLTERHTQLGEGESAVHTVEHVLSAVTALEIDDLLIDMSGPEPPILDGSAAPFYDALIAVGIEELPGEPEYLTLTEPLRVIDGNSVYEAHPANELSLDVTIEFPHPVIGRQVGRYVVGRESYRDQMAAARTFGFLNEVEELRAKGLIQGASTDNAVVLDDTGVVANVLRWHDEFLRHKALDCVGDLALVGARVKARIVAVRPSHRGTVTLVREMVRAGRRAGSTEQGAKSMAGTMSIEEIMKVLPHRYPFLLIDRILEIDGKQRIVGMKNVTINEPFFQGHFPGHPIMPGVLIIEAMAQVGGMLLMGGLEEAEQKVVYFMSLDNVRFRKPVRPGDQIRFELDVIQIRGAVCKMRGVAKVDGELVAEAEMAAMVRDR